MIKQYQRHHLKDWNKIEYQTYYKNYFLLDPQTSLYNCHVCKSNYNHSGNFKQHLLKHERESGSISATLVAQAGQNPHLTSVLQSAMTDRVDKCDREFEEKKNQYRKNNWS